MTEKKVKTLNLSDRPKQSRSAQQYSIGYSLGMD
jgi:hypothetical protein